MLDISKLLRDEFTCKVDTMSDSEKDEIIFQLQEKVSAMKAQRDGYAQLSTCLQNTYDKQKELLDNKIAQSERLHHENKSIINNLSYARYELDKLKQEVKEAQERAGTCDQGNNNFEEEEGLQQQLLCSSQLPLLSHQLQGYNDMLQGSEQLKQNGLYSQQQQSQKQLFFSQNHGFVSPNLQKISSQWSMDSSQASIIRENKLPGNNSNGNSFLHGISRYAYLDIRKQFESMQQNNEEEAEVITVNPIYNNNNHNRSNSNGISSVDQNDNTKLIEIPLNKEQNTITSEKPQLLPQLEYSAETNSKRLNAQPGELLFQNFLLIGPQFQASNFSANINNTTSTTLIPGISSAAHLLNPSMDQKNTHALQSSLPSQSPVESIEDMNADILYEMLSGQLEGSWREVLCKHAFPFQIKTKKFTFNQTISSNSSTLNNLASKLNLLRVNASNNYNDIQAKSFVFTIEGQAPKINKKKKNNNNKNGKSSQGGDNKQDKGGNTLGQGKEDQNKKNKNIKDDNSSQEYHPPPLLEASNSKHRQYCIFFEWDDFFVFNNKQPNNNNNSNSLSNISPPEKQSFSVSASSSSTILLKTPLTFCFLTYYPFFSFFNDIFSFILSQLHKQRLSLLQAATPYSDIDANWIIKEFKKQASIYQRKLMDLQIVQPYVQQLLTFDLEEPIVNEDQEENQGNKELKNNEKQQKNKDGEWEVNNDDINDNFDQTNEDNNNPSIHLSVNYMIPNYRQCSQLETSEGSGSNIILQLLTFEDFWCILNLLMLEQQLVFVSSSITAVAAALQVLPAFFKPFNASSLLLHIFDSTLPLLETPPPFIAGLNYPFKNLDKLSLPDSSRVNFIDLDGRKMYLSDETIEIFNKQQGFMQYSMYFYELTMAFSILTRQQYLQPNNLEILDHASKKLFNSVIFKMSFPVDNTSQNQFIHNKFASVPSRAARSMEEFQDPQSKTAQKHFELQTALYAKKKEEYKIKALEEIHELLQKTYKYYILDHLPKFPTVDIDSKEYSAQSFIDRILRKAPEKQFTRLFLQTLNFQYFFQTYYENLCKHQSAKNNNNNNKDIQNDHQLLEEQQILGLDQQQQMNSNGITLKNPDSLNSFKDITIKNR